MNKKTKNVYRSCNEVETACMVIVTSISSVDKWLAPCCNLAITNIASEVTDDPEESFNKFIEYRHNMIEESKRIYQSDDPENQERIFTSKCVDCPAYVVNEWDNSTDEITFVGLSMSPAPCQSKCLYCGHIKYDHKLDDKGKEAYERLFKYLSYIKENKNLNKDTVWQVASGEISIHPYKNEILKLVDGLNTRFLTNCFVFDQGIADHLKKNPWSSLNLSIDSGSSFTWKKVKGYNNFHNVVNNLRKYVECCEQETYQQVTLKYIILPGINTNIVDYKGVIRIMKELKIYNLIISRNLCDYMEPASKKYNDFFKNVIKLASLCKINQLSYMLHTDAFSPDDRVYIDNQVDKILSGGK